MTDFNAVKADYAVVLQQLEILEKDTREFTAKLLEAVEARDVSFSEAQIDNWQSHLDVLNIQKAAALNAAKSLVSTLDVHIEALDEAVDTAIYEMAIVVAKKEKTLEIEGSTFKRLLDLGRVTKLEGTIGSDSTELRLNNVGAIRPPVEYISDDVVLRIKDIVLQMNSGTILNKGAISLIVQF